jgi:drug/metabolite transporter (DMT)-like permease
LALLLFLPLAWPHLREGWPIVRAHWVRLTALGALGAGMYNALSYIGLTYTTATNGVILNSFCPILIIGLSWAFFGKRLSRQEVAGVAISLIGVLLIVMRADINVLLSLRLNIGDLWVLASVTSWAAYTCLLGGRPQQLNNWVFLVSISLIGLLLMSPIYVWEILSGKLINPVPQSFLAITYTGLFPAFLGYIFWNRGVVEVGASRAGLFMHLMPVFGVLLSMIFLGEQPALYHLLGIGLILGGIMLTVRSRPTPS